MAKPGKIPDFRKIYPEASDEVIEILRRTERKMQYQEYDLKVEQVIVDQKNQTVTIRPSREISYERMMESGKVVLKDAVDVETMVLEQLLRQQLYDAIDSLTMEEQYLIIQLFFFERKEWDLAKELGISQKGVNKRKAKILKKMRERLNNKENVGFK